MTHLIIIYFIIFDYFFVCFIVLATYREPVRGWIDNMYGPTGMIVGVYMGVLHTYVQDSNTVSDLIPADIVVNALICATARKE